MEKPMKPINTSLERTIKQLQLENTHLKKQLERTQQELDAMRLQYHALEEDFLHALRGEEAPSLQGKKIAYIGGHTEWQSEYQAIVQHYQGELIVPTSDNIEAVCEAIEVADEVICPSDCRNQALCHAARSSCSRFNKPLRPVANSTPQSLQQELSDIAIDIQSPTNMEIPDQLRN